MSGRLFTIPDIHGRLDLLAVLMQKLWKEESLDLAKDKLIFLGDMVDRGLSSRGVLDCLRSLQEKFGDRIVILAGNHEWLMIDAIRKVADPDAFYLWMINGGDKTLESYGAQRYWGKPSNAHKLLNHVPIEDVEWLESLPLYHEEPGFFFSHAPISKYAKRQTEGSPFRKDELIWTYEDRPEDLWSRKHDDGVIGICGHIHRLRRGIMEPRFYEHYIFGDAGCGCADLAPLVAIEVKSRKVIFSWPKAIPSQMGINP